MDNQNSQNEQQAKKKTIAFITSAILAILLVLTIGYFTLTKIKGEQAKSDVMSQEQFESSPVVSSNIQSECQQSAVKLTQLKKIDDLENEFKSHVENCRDIYFAIDGTSSDSKLRKEGMYADLVVDIAHFALKENKERAIALLNFAKTLRPWEFYLGPVSCESHHVLDAYLESIDLPAQKVCIKPGDYKKDLFSAIEAKNYNIFRSMLSNDDVVWMGQPESDVGCPEKLSSVIEVIKRLTDGPTNIQQPKTDANNGTDVYISIQSHDTEKVALVFKTENDCLQLKSVLVPNLEVSE